MPSQYYRTYLPVAILILLLAISMDATAGTGINNAGLLDNVIGKYQTAATSWASIITGYASNLFWILVTISMVWTFGMMALRKADIGEFFAELIKFLVFTGFYWWLLENGPKMAMSIIDSLRDIGASATGTRALTPSTIVDMGFEVFSNSVKQSTIWKPVDSAAGILMSTAFLVVLALVGINMLILLVSAWILAYAGIFFLGFGGSRWTSDMAINYFKTVLSTAAQLLTMVLLIGIGESFVREYYTNASNGLALEELAVLLISSIVLLALVNKIPPMIGGLAMGGGTGSLGSGFGAGAAVGATAAAGAAAATAGAMAMKSYAAIGGGAQAVKAAFKEAAAHQAASKTTSLIDSTGIDISNSLGGKNEDPFGTDNSSSPLEQAMGSNRKDNQVDSESQSRTSETINTNDDKSNDRIKNISPDNESSLKDSGTFTKLAQTAALTAGAGVHLAKGIKDVAIKKPIDASFGGRVRDAIKSRTAEARQGEQGSAISNLTQGIKDVASAEHMKRINASFGGRVRDAIKSEDNQASQNNQNSTDSDFSTFRNK